MPQEGHLEELERTAEPSWSTLVEPPFEKIVIDGRQKVKFDLRLEQSEPIHSAFNELFESHSITDPQKD
ncbi:hypothetical protein NL676_012444 [Syzygium grande]|nr:hypothetical protein NL676_012444 [Syzygium grande]